MRQLKWFKTPTIARNLTVSLVAAVVLVTMAASAGYHLLLRHEEQAVLEATATEQAQLVAESLALPMWFLHMDSIRSIARAYAAKDMVTGLVIRDSRGKILFSYRQKRPPELQLLRSEDIVHQGSVLGRVDLTLTAQSLRETRRRLLLYSGLTIAMVSITLALFTGLFLRIFLKRPFARVEQVVRAYGSGDLDVPPVDTPPRELAGLMGTLQDMARRIQDQMAALAMAEDKYRSMFNNAMEGMFQSSLDGRLLTANPAMAHMLGYDSPEALLAACGDNAFALYENQADRKRFLVELLKQGNVRDFEARFRRADGSLAWGRIQARLVRDENGEVSHIQGNSEDVTRQVMTRQALQEAKEHAEAASRLKSDFLSMVSHDLRTPLTSVLGFTKVIHNRLERTVFPRLPEGDAELDAARAQVAGNLEIIISESKRLTAIINDVLDLAKLESRRTKWDMRPTDLNALVRQCLAATRSLFQEKGLTQRSLPAKSLPKVECDSERIMQVLVNLVSNAVKFTDHGCVTCVTRDDGDQAEVVVEDTGIGIPLESQQDIFDKFRQLGDTLTEKPDGTGLGLSICIQIVEQHGGRMWVVSEPGRGSAFHFTIPYGEKAVVVGSQDMPDA